MFVCSLKAFNQWGISVSLLKKVLLVALVPALVLSGNLATAADVPGEQFVIGNPPTNDRYTGINFSDDQATRNTYSSLEAFTANGTDRSSQMLTRATCSKMGAPGCGDEKYFQYNAQLGMCNEKVTSDCVTKVFAKDESGNEIVGKYVEDFPGPGEFSYEGNPAINLPTGVSTFIVDFPSIPHAGGTQYLMVVWLQGSRGFNESKFKIENFNSGIYAVSKKSGRFSVTKPETIVRPDFRLGGRQASQGGFNMDQSQSRRASCAQTSTTVCLVPWSLPSNVTFGYTLKLHEGIAGWLHGRISDAQAEITSASDGDQLLTIQGKPTTVPGIYAWFKKDAYPTPLQNYYSTVDRNNENASGLGWPSLDGKINNGPDGLPYSIMKENFGYEEGGFKEVLAWIASLSDKATYQQSVWTVRSMQSGQFANCVNGTNSLSGIVTTNSTMYIGNPPTFDKESQSLDYKVVSPHYLPNGEEFKGSYDLVIKSDVARCIYGFSSAPVSAKITILSADGTTQVATTTFNERNGWMYLVARGFTFSSPTVRVKLTQEAAPSATPAPTPSAMKAPTSKKATITCVKGKTSKKVTAVKPACPSGWKKK